MSGFKVFSSGKDLDAIFATRTGTDPSAQLVPFVTPAMQNLSERYFPYTSGTKAPATGYKTFDINGNMVDLSDLYRKIVGWNALGAGAYGGSFPSVFAIGVLDASNVFVGGRFTSAGDVSANYIARWNGSNWFPLGSGVGGTSPTVEAIAVLDASNVLVGGNFTSAGDVSCNNIARWDGSNWFPLGSGVGGGGVASIAVLDASNVFVGGFFTSAGGTTGINRIARWDGSSNWFPLGTLAVNGVGGGGVASIAVLDASNVFVGGSFTSAGGTNGINRIARWNGSNWFPLGTPLANGVGGGAVRAIAVLDTSNVFVGGNFTSAGGTTGINRIARWDGSTNWFPLGTLAVNGVGANVDAIAVLNARNVFVGGSFLKAGDVSANYIARWDGSSNWFPLGTPSVNGVGSSVVAIKVLDATNVFAGGIFVTAGDVSANRIAVWG